MLLKYSVHYKYSRAIKPRLHESCGLPIVLQYAGTARAAMPRRTQTESPVIYNEQHCPLTHCKARQKVDVYNLPAKRIHADKQHT